MQKKYLYFQPQYVSRFKCDASKCLENCCAKNWTVDIDAATYEKYSQLKPPEKARELTKLFAYNKGMGKYLLKAHPCPMLTENNLCNLQLEYGEDFLSETCITYPRRTSDFGYFFERSLTLTCSVAAEMILFAKEPLRFEAVEVPERIHSCGGKITIKSMNVKENFAAHLPEMQIAMISILQTRTLSIDQRLIVLGFFFDKLDEISAKDLDVPALTNLIAAYKSKTFWARQVPQLLASVRFDAKKFVALMIKLFNRLYGGVNEKFIANVVDALRIVTDENNRVSVSKVAANYRRLAAARKNFLAHCSTVLENYLVNELFLNGYPFRFKIRIADNYAVFVTTYKIFELILFAATLKGFGGKEDVLRLVSWFSMRTEHGSGEVYQKIFACIRGAGDTFDLMESLLEGGD